MSNEILGNTKAELLAWMKGSSKTLGWDALLAFDRATINNIFREQYISSYGAGGGFPSINSSKALTGGIARFFDECVLGAPLLSFEKADIVEPTASGLLTMPVLSGREMTIDYNNGAKLTKISQVNALNGPLLQVELALQKQSQLGYVGVIAVDLAAGSKYTLSSGATPLETELTGDMFKRVFDEWPARLRFFVMNRIKFNAGPLQVDSFSFRTQVAPGAATRGAANYGDGAVVAFIKMKGGLAGTFPSAASQLRYLIPSDAVSPYTTTTVVKPQKFLVEAFNYLVERANTQGEYWMLNSSGSGYTLNEGATLPVLSFWGRRFSPDLSTISVGKNGEYASLSSSGTHGSKEVWGIYPEAGSHGSLRITESGRVHFEVKLTDMVELIDIFRVIKGAKVGGQDKAGVERYRVKHNGISYADVDVVLSDDGRFITLSEIKGRATEATAMGQHEYTSSLAPWATVEAALRPKVGSSLEGVVTRMATRPLHFSLLPLNTFLFSPPYAAQLTEVALPADLVMFGHVAPHVTAFEILTPLYLMGHGRTHTFAASGNPTGIAWTVTRLPGELGGIGQINVSSGQYTAPQAADIPGLQVRVKVTASKGGFSASALVTVVRKEININPLIQFAAAGSSVKCELSAGALDASGKRWGDIDPARGSLIPSTVAMREKSFVAPAEKLQKQVLDVVPVTVTAGGATETAYVAVIHTPATLTVTAAISSARSAQLSALYDGEPSIDTLWTVVAGSGEVDPTTGLLQVPATPAEPFVLVTAEEGAGGGRYFGGYILLPLPLAAFPAMPSADPGASEIDLG